MPHWSEAYGKQVDQSTWILLGALKISGWSSSCSAGARERDASPFLEVVQPTGDDGSGKTEWKKYLTDRQGCSLRSYSWSTLRAKLFPPNVSSLSALTLWHFQVSHWRILSQIKYLLKAHYGFDLTHMENTDICSRHLDTHPRTVLTKLSSCRRNESDSFFQHPAQPAPPTRAPRCLTYASSSSFTPVLYSLMSTEIKSKTPLFAQKEGEKKKNGDGGRAGSAVRLVVWLMCEAWFPDRYIFPRSPWM